MINLTLFVQMANLWITYQLLSRIVLKDLLVRILDREDLTRRTIKYFSFLEHRIARLQKEKTALMTKFSSTIPAVPTPAPSTVPVPIEQAPKQQIDTDTLSNILVTRYKP